MLSTKDAIQLCTTIRASAREAATNRQDCRYRLWEQRALCMVASVTSVVVDVRESREEYGRAGSPAVLVSG